jgi:hypothetical protein
MIHFAMNEIYQLLREQETCGYRVNVPVVGHSFEIASKKYLT